MKLFIQLLLFCVLSFYTGYAQFNPIPQKSLSQIDKEHQLLKKLGYNPNPSTTLVDSLLDQDFSQFNYLVDLACLIKYDSLYNSNLYDLVNQLQTEESEIKLSELSVQISKYGEEALVALEKIEPTSKKFIYWRQIIRTIVLGYEMEDFVIQKDEDFQLFNISKDVHQSKYYYSYYEQFAGERKYLRDELADYIDGEVYEEHKIFFHNIVVDAFKQGVINSHLKYSIIQKIIKQESQNRDEVLLNDYLTLIDSITTSEAISLLSFINSNTPSNYYPRIFLNLLDHPNDTIVSNILSYSSNCWDKNICSEVKVKILKVFNEGSEAIKFDAAFTLMHDYEDQTAYDYLITKVDSPDKAIKRIAISWLGDTCNHGDPMSPKLDSALRKYLLSENPRIKRATIETYLTYNSPNVIEAIIPYVDYELDFVAKDIIKKLTNYKDKSLVRNKLSSYVSSGKGNETHQQILQELK